MLTAWQQYDARTRSSCWTRAVSSSGGPDKLMKKKGAYTALVAAQAVVRPPSGRSGAPIVLLSNVSRTTRGPVMVI